MNKKKVLVVDDSAFMRKMISEMLLEHPLLDVIATGRNGKEAVEKAILLKPDVITLDVEMPEMDGLEALKHIMNRQPTPVVMLSSLTKEGSDTTLTALERGAVDFIAKPSGAISLDLHKVRDLLIEKVLAASRANISMKPALPAAVPVAEKPVPVIKRMSSSRERTIVLIATSTGGPRALQHVVTKLPADLDAPVFVVQHMPAGFTKSLAERLNTLSQVRVKEAESGEEAVNGTVYIAPGGKHMRITGSGSAMTVTLDESPPEGGHRPAANVTFRSATALLGIKKVAVIMTGMGSDGAEGLIALKESGQTTAIAESESTCVVYGMPKAAAATHLVNDVVPVNEIAEQIVKHVYDKR